MLKNVTGSYNLLIETKNIKQQSEARKQKTRQKISTVAKLIAWVEKYGVKSMRDDVMVEFTKVLNGDYANLESRAGVKRQTRIYRGGLRIRNNVYNFSAFLTIFSHFGLKIVKMAFFLKKQPKIRPKLGPNKKLILFLKFYFLFVGPPVRWHGL